MIYGKVGPLSTYQVCDGTVEAVQSPRQVSAVNAQQAAETDALVFSNGVPAAFFSELEHYGRCLVVSRSVFSSCGHLLGTFTVLIREGDRAVLTMTDSMAAVMVRGKHQETRWWARWWGTARRWWRDAWAPWWWLRERVQADMDHSTDLQVQVLERAREAELKRQQDERILQRIDGDILKFAKAIGVTDGDDGWQPSLRMRLAYLEMLREHRYRKRHRW